jgi:hypothetical protein
MLGKTVPESNSDGRQFVCTAGYDLELQQPIRIYPMARYNCPARWSISQVPVERNPRDSRVESWKIKGDRSPGAHQWINSVIRPIQTKVSHAVEREIAKSLTVRSLHEANARRLSLCVLLPEDLPHLDLERGEVAEMAPTPDMFGEARELPVAARFKWHPRLRFTDQDGHHHDLMLRDWGCYEWMRKNGDDAAVQLDENLNLSTAPPLLCGNLNRFRNSWLVISVFSGTVHARPDVFDRQFALFDEATAQ